MARRTARKPKADCPNCYRTLYFEVMPELGQQAICPICESSLEVIHRNPLILYWVVDHYPDESYEEDDLVYFDEDNLEHEDYGDEEKIEYRASRNGHDREDANLKN